MTDTLSLIQRLPVVEGRYTPDYPLGEMVWFRVGGAAEVLFRPKDAPDLAEFLKNKPPEVPYMVVGVGSNLLVRDGGIPGVVIRLGRGFNDIAVEGSCLRVGAGVLDRNVALTAAEYGIGGLSFLMGIPGTIGGAVVMNAGCYGSEIKDVLHSCKVMDPQGKVHTLTPSDLHFGYRHARLPEGWIVLEAVLEGYSLPAPEIYGAMQKIQAQREASQPVSSRTGGSTFKNPPGEKAWALIDAAGFRGAMVGGAQVSPLHCNFLLNTGTATAQDLETLGDKIRETVYNATGILLEWEIKRVGCKLESPR